MTLRKRKVKPKKLPRIEVSRRVAGLQILMGGKCIPSASILYEVWYTDTSTSFVRGRSVRALMSSDDINGTKAEQAESLRAYQPDLMPIISAAHALFQELERRCLELDKPKK